MKRPKLIEYIECPEVFKELEVLFYAAWNDYEECAWVCVFKFFDEIMVCEHGETVMCETQEFQFDPYKIFNWEFEELKKEWKEIPECDIEDYS